MNLLHRRLVLFSGCLLSWALMLMLFRPLREGVAVLVFYPVGWILRGIGVACYMENLTLHVPRYSLPLTVPFDGTLALGIALAFTASGPWRAWKVIGIGVALTGVLLILQICAIASHLLAALVGAVLVVWASDILFVILTMMVIERIVRFWGRGATFESSTPLSSEFLGQTRDANRP